MTFHRGDQFHKPFKVKNFTVDHLIEKTVDFFRFHNQAIHNKKAMKIVVVNVFVAVSLVCEAKGLKEGDKAEIFVLF